jgi:nucleoporin POM152
VDRREDFCVGEVVQFQLEGTPPWSIGYQINGKAFTQEVKMSPFSLLQQQPGEVSFTSIAHQQKMCKATIPNLKFTVHSLPSARVGHGKRILQDIHEGMCIRLCKCDNLLIVLQAIKRRLFLSFSENLPSLSRIKGPS